MSRRERFERSVSKKSKEFGVKQERRVEGRFRKAARSRNVWVEGGFRNRNSEGDRPSSRRLRVHARPERPRQREQRREIELHRAPRR